MKRSPLGLIVLWLLVEQPMHVYRMQKQIEAFGKDKVVNVRSRASLYQALERLMRHGLVEVRETVRSEGYPDRVVYAITDAGRETAEEWLREMLRTTGNQYPHFIAAVSVLLNEGTAARYQRFLMTTGQTFAIIGMLAAWRLFDVIFGPIFVTAINLLHWGSHYG